MGWVAGDDGGGERRWEGQLEETIATTDGVQNAEGCRIDRSGRTHPLRSPRRGALLPVPSMCTGDSMGTVVRAAPGPRTVKEPRGRL